MRRPRRPSRAALAALLAALLAPAALSAPTSAAVAQEAYKDWRRACPENAAGDRTCVAYTQNASTTRIGPVAVRLTTGRRDTGQAVLVVDIGAPVIQQRGFAVTVDGQKPLIATFAQCDQTACRGILAGDAADALIQQFRRGKAAKVTYFAQPRTPVDVGLSLRGFSAAFDSLPKGRG